MKKFTLIWMIGLLPIFSLNAATTTYKCGENCTATLDENGVLRVSGTGKMNDYLNNREESPFYNNLAIKKIIVEEGITHIDRIFFAAVKILNMLNSPTVCKKSVYMLLRIFLTYSLLPCQTQQFGVLRMR